MKDVKSILTAQKGGFAATGPYPFTHTLSPYTGCAFGNTACGQYCYAQYLPNWTYSNDGAAWGGAVHVKRNAAEILDVSLRRMKPETRRGLRLFMASTTDPYQPVEATYAITRECLEVFARYDDLDLLVVQTRSPLARRDFDLLARIPYAWFSVTIETDDQAFLQRLGGGPSVAKRFALIEDARDRGLRTQVAIAPCIPYSDRFPERLAESGANRFVVDAFTVGDGARGQRTARSPYAQVDPDWRDTAPAQLLFERLQALGCEVGWSAAGFAGIPPRFDQSTLGQRRLDI